MSSSFNTIVPRNHIGYFNHLKRRRSGLRAHYRHEHMFSNTCVNSIAELSERILTLNKDDTIKVLQSFMMNCLSHCDQPDAVIQQSNAEITRQMQWNRPATVISNRIMQFSDSRTLYSLMRLNKNWKHDVCVPARWYSVDCRYDYESFEMKNNVARQPLLLLSINQMPIQSLTLIHNADLYNSAPIRSLQGRDSSLSALNLIKCRGFGKFHTGWRIPDQLQVLYLNQCIINTWKSLRFQEATSLRTLSLYKSTIRSNELLRVLQDCTQLNSIQLLQLPDTAIDHEVRRQLFQGFMPQLRKLFIGEIRSLLDVSPGNTFQHSLIQHFTWFSDNLDPVFPRSIRSLFNSFRSLRDLTLQLKSVYLQELQASCFSGELQSLKLLVSDNDDESQYPIVDFAFLSTFVQLKTFHCILYSHVRVIYVVEHFDTIGRCVGLSDVSLAFNNTRTLGAYLQVLAHDLPALHSLDLFYCSNLVGDDLRAFAGHQSLSVLNVDLDDLILPPCTDLSTWSALFTPTATQQQRLLTTLREQSPCNLQIQCCPATHNALTEFQSFPRHNHQENQDHIVWNAQDSYYECTWNRALQIL